MPECGSEPVLLNLSCREAAALAVIFVQYRALTAASITPQLIIIIMLPIKP
jgi:hypothetical protein